MNSLQVCKECQQLDQTRNKELQMNFHKPEKYKPWIMNLIHKLFLAYTPVSA